MGVPRPGYSYPAKDSELLGYFVSVLLSTGLRFAEANTESTASLWTAEDRTGAFGSTPIQTHRGHSGLCHTVKVNDDGRCIPALTGEVVAPCTAFHKLHCSLVALHNLSCRGG